ESPLCGGRKALRGLGRLSAGWRQRTEEAKSMGANQVPPAEEVSGPAEGVAATAEERLERGEVLYYPTAPFALPGGADLTFLLGQQLGGMAHKNISYDPASCCPSRKVRSA